MFEKLKIFLHLIYYFPNTRKFKKRGKNLHFSIGGSFVNPREIEMGNNIFISNNFHISAYKLKFGSNIMIGPNLVLECTNHKTNKVGKTMFAESRNKIRGGVTIEDDVWLGANVTILPNVIIPEGCVVGAGSIVTKKLPPYSICVGIPCKPIKKRFSDIEMKQHLEIIKKSNYQIDDILNHWKEYNL